MTEQELVGGLVEDPTRRVRTIPSKESCCGPEIGRVLLPRNPVENGMVLIEVDKKFVDGPCDDGLRELSADQLEWAP